MSWLWLRMRLRLFWWFWWFWLRSWYAVVVVMVVVVVVVRGAWLQMYIVSLLAWTAETVPSKCWNTIHQSPKVATLNRPKRMPQETFWSPSKLYNENPKAPIDHSSVQWKKRCRTSGPPKSQLWNCAFRTPKHHPVWGTNKRPRNRHLRSSLAALPRGVGIIHVHISMTKSVMNVRYVPWISCIKLRFWAIICKYGLIHEVFWSEGLQCCKEMTQHGFCRGVVCARLLTCFHPFRYNRRSQRKWSCNVTFLVWHAQCLVTLQWFWVVFSWQTHYLVRLQCEFSWHALR